MRLLLLDTNFSSLPIYEHLLSEGHEVFVIGNNENDFLARISNNYINADYTHINEVNSIVESCRIDRVIPGSNDHSFLSWMSLDIVNMAADKKNSIDILFNKSKFRDYCMKNSLPSPRSVSARDLEQWSGRFPLIVKPVDSFSGKGITVVPEGESSVAEAMSVAANASLTGGVVAEEFVSGQLFSHSAFLSESKIEHDFFVREYGVRNKYAVDLSYLDNEIDEEIRSKVRNTIEFIASDLDLDDGLLHTQFITHGEKIWLVEITRRCPGDLYSLLVEFSTGFKYAAAYADLFTSGAGHYRQCLKKSFLSQRSDFSNVIRSSMTAQRDGIYKGLTKRVSLESIFEFIRISPGQFVSSNVRDRIAVCFYEALSKPQLHQVVNDFIGDKAYEIRLVGD